MIDAEEEDNNAIVNHVKRNDPVMETAKLQQKVIDNRKYHHTLLILVNN